LTHTINIITSSSSKINPCPQVLATENHYEQTEQPKIKGTKKSLRINFLLWERKTPKLSGYFFYFVFPPPYSGTQIQAKPIWRSGWLAALGGLRRRFLVRGGVTACF
jgi:hypothetical protein